MSVQLTNAHVFPPVWQADASGLLAWGGDLSVARLVLAYRSGIFPWYSEGSPILWWAPDPRCVLFPRKLHVTASTARIVRRGDLEVRADTAFDHVIAHCRRVPRAGQSGTWITAAMETAYRHLHREGYAHSVEVWQRERGLVGGLYGVSLGAMFFGESMFSVEPNMSKVALLRLVDHLTANDFQCVDCQVESQHLLRLGAECIPRAAFQDLLAEALNVPTRKGAWTRMFVARDG